jgi:hypothetical protein
MAHRQSHTSERGWLPKGVKEANYAKGQTSRSNTAGRRAELIGCRRWWLIWCIVRWL